MSAHSIRNRFAWSFSFLVVSALVASGARSADASPESDGTSRDAAASPDRPNVLFIMTDEQHYRSLSATGNPYIETPNMDRIVREGALFSNATCVTPYCSPSRASIITGVYPHRHRILLNVSPNRNQQPPLAQDAFPNTESILHQAGYQTAHRGKWHLGNPGNFDCYESRVYSGKTNREYANFLREQLPPHQFKDHTGPGMYLGRPVEMVPAMQEAYRKFNVGKSRLGYIAIVGRSLIPPPLLPETRITDEVLDLLDKHARERFMITVSWSPPHDLWVIPEPYYSMVDRKKIQLHGTGDLPPWDMRGPSKQLGDLASDEGLREYAAIYHGMVKYIDDQLGRILKKLDDLELADNTLVIFTTDHGDMVGAHRCVGKSITGFFDDLVHIPLAMRLPGRIRAGTVVRQPVSQIDLMPTILDFVQLPVPRPIHGQSLRPLLEGRDVPWRDYAFCQRADRLRMLRTDRYKYVFCDRPRIVAAYDLQNDPDEDRNLASDPENADLVRQMHRRLLEVMESDGDPLREKLPSDPLK